ncbi:MAG: hypothetical protein ACI90V_013079, partial [Bacillariaceae sp.]
AQWYSIIFDRTTTPFLSACHQKFSLEFLWSCS